VSPRLAAAALLLLAACRPGAPAEPPPAAPSEETSAAGETDAALLPSAWRASPAEGTELRAPGVTVETGPHTVLWPAEAEPLVPPYTVRAELAKHQGRIHEGYGVVFGARGLEGPESGQEYGYFLVRGDGSYLVKLRRGPATPVVRDWTRHPRIHRDAEGPARPNLLEVRVGADTTRFLVNGAEVDHVPTAELPVRGVAGVRIAHDVVVELRAFRASAGAP
jgi:hypothetical protein